MKNLLALLLCFALTGAMAQEKLLNQKFPPKSGNTVKDSDINTAFKEVYKSVVTAWDTAVYYAPARLVRYKKVDYEKINTASAGISPAADTIAWIKKPIYFGTRQDNGDDIVFQDLDDAAREQIRLNGIGDSLHFWKDQEQYEDTDTTIWYGRKDSITGEWRRHLTVVLPGGGGGGGSSSPLTTKGDIWGYSTANTRLPVGANGYGLLANSSASTGLLWTDLSTIYVDLASNQSISGTKTFSGLVNLASTTTSLLGVVTQNGFRFLHSYGTKNVFLGKNAGNFTQTGTGHNIGLGETALQANTTGSRNVAIGLEAMYSNTTGSLNTAIGEATLYNHTTGQYNTGIGPVVLYNTTTGTANTGIGKNALYSNTTASNNVAIGHETMYYNTTGYSNTAIGSLAGRNNTTGNNNTYIGYGISGATSGRANTLIGANLNLADGTKSNLIIIGDGDGHQRINVDSLGRVGLGTDTPTEQLEVSGGSVKIADLGSGLIFPDGSVQTTAATGGGGGSSSNADSLNSQPSSYYLNRANHTGSMPTSALSGTVSNSQQATMAGHTFKGNNSGSIASPSDLTISQVKTELAIANTDVSGLGTLSTQSGTFSGTHSGSSSGTNTGDQTNISGNAATVTTNANLTGDVTSVGNASTLAGQFKVKKQTFTATASQTVFTISSTITTPLYVVVAGIVAAPADFTATGTTLTLTTAAAVGEIVQIIYL